MGMGSFPCYRTSVNRFCHRQIDVVGCFNEKKKLKESGRTAFTVTLCFKLSFGYRGWNRSFFNRSTGKNGKIGAVDEWLDQLRMAMNNENRIG